LGADTQTDLGTEIARLTGSIDRVAAATEVALSDRPSVCADDDRRSLLTERDELCRQLAALRDHVIRAEARNEGPGALHVELATLLSFAKTLQADADAWRSALGARAKELERNATAAREQRERLAAERESLVAEREKIARRRDALQTTIIQTGARIAQQHRGECRRTVPVFTLAEGLTVCSVSVSCPRRGFRFAKQWLVTLTGSHDLLVRRE
jgi:chromosome segregation ATPase